MAPVATGAIRNEAPAACGRGASPYLILTGICQIYVSGGVIRG